MINLKELIRLRIDSTVNDCTRRQGGSLGYIALCQRGTMQRLNALYL